MDKLVEGSSSGSLGVRAGTLIRLAARLAVMVPLAALLHGAGPAWGQVVLGAAEDFAILAGTAVTCTDSTLSGGDVGVDLGGTFTPTNCTITPPSTLHSGDLVAQQAYDDLLIAYAAVAAEPCTNTTLPGLGGQILMPGVYCFDAGVTETGTTLTLFGAPTDTWIFKIGTGGTGAFTGTNFTVSMPGGQACSNNVFWWTAEAATLTDSAFLGTILAGTSISTTNAITDGRALAQTAVTVTGTSLCGAVPLPPPTQTGTPGPSPTPTPTTTPGPSVCDALGPTIVGTAGDDEIDGTEGNDVISGRGGHDFIRGLAGDDVICGDDGDDVLRGRGGRDTIYGGRGYDHIRGGGGDDILHGGRDDDTIHGLRGNDVLQGGKGFDYLAGGEGNDVLRGGKGDDVLVGWFGEDICRGGDGVDFLDPTCEVQQQE